MWVEALDHFKWGLPSFLEQFSSNVQMWCKHCYGLVQKWELQRRSLFHCFWHVKIMQSPKRLLRTGSLHLKSALADFSRVWKGFAGNTVTPQQTTKNLQNTSHSLATHFHKCCLRAVFTTKNFVQYLSCSLTLNASVKFCLMFPSQNFVAPLLSHFPNTFQQNSIQFIKPPPKSCARLQKAANRGIWKK